MESYTGPLAKMKTELGSPTRYTLSLGEHELSMNDFIGRTLGLHYTGQIRCFCGEMKTKTYRQNFCYNSEVFLYLIKSSSELPCPHSISYVFS